MWKYMHNKQLLHLWQAKVVMNVLDVSKVELGCKSITAPSIINHIILHIGGIQQSGSRFLF